MKTSSFKKVLALVLALAMVLSVCTASFSVSAETADLSYFVLNDASGDNGWESGSTVATRALGDRLVYRIAPQKAGTSQLGFKNDVGSFTADDLAAVNTLSYYVKNETDAPLKYRYQYYANNGADVGCFANGYVYLVAADEAEIAPIKVASDGYITLPAKFEGYVVYDLSDPANYDVYARIKTGTDEATGEAIWDTTNTVVDYVKAQSFQSLYMFVANTEDMLTKAWYVDDIAVSTKTVEELAKYLTGGEIVAYNYNMANVGGMSADESIIFWGTRYDNDGVVDGNAYSQIVDYDDSLDGKGSKFTLVNASGANIGNIDIRDSFRDSRGTDLPFAIDKAVGYKFDVAVEGKVQFALQINGQGNNMSGNLYYVYEDGTVVYDQGVPTDFKGTVYCVFDELTVKGTTPWATYINETLAGKDFNMSMYSDDSGVVAGSTITLGGFSFIYDAAPVTAAFEPEATNNPVIFDGNETPMRWGADGNQPASYYDNWTILGGKEMTAVYKGTSTSNWLFFNHGGKKYEGTLDAANVKGLSFKLKTPADGETTLTMGMGGDNNRRFYGTMYAYDIYGNMVASFTPDDTTQSKVTLPAGFEGIIVLDAAGDTSFSTNYSSGKMSFADFYNAGKFNGIHLMVSKTGGYVVGETTYVYDDLTVIYDTIEDYIAGYQASCPEAESYMIYDGTKQPRNSYAKDWDVTVSDHYTAVYNGNPTSTANHNFIRFDDSTIKTLNFDVSKVQGWAFKFKAPDDGYTHQFTINMQWENADVYRGLMYAIDKKGTTVASRAYRWDGGITLKLPSGFDGYIVMKDDINQETAGAYIKGYVGGENMTGYKTFAEHYAERAGLYGFTLRMGKRLDTDGTTTVDFEAGVTTYEYDDLVAITQDVDTYMANLSAGLLAEYAAAAEAAAHEDGYMVNNFSGINGNTAGIYTVNGTNNVDVNYGLNFSEDFSCAIITFNPTHPAGGQRDHNMKVVNTAGLDLSKIAGFKYRVDITNPDSVGVEWSYKLNNDATNLIGKTAYAVSDTGEVTKFSDKVSFKSEFHGYIVVTFNDGLVVAPNYGGTATITWADWVTANGLNDIRMWLGNTGAFEMTEATETEPSVLTGGYANFLMEYDDLVVLYEDAPILESLNAKYDTEKYYNAATSVSSLGAYSSATTLNSAHAETAPYDVEVVAMENIPTGSAFKFTRNENAWVSGRELNVGGSSTLAADEIKALDAVAFWVKVPEGQKIALSRNISGEPYSVRTSTLTYDTVKKEFTLVGGTDGAGNSLSGFEGYVIIPLQNALLGSSELKFTEIYGSTITKLSSYFYIGNSWDYTATEWYLGEFQAVENLGEFLAEIGAETTPGDVNNDTEVDVRDIVRLKKFNADAKTSLAYQNADIDGNGLIETAAELVNAKKQNIGVDYKANEIDASLVDYPETMVGLYHGGYGSWDSLYSDVIAESEIVNMYSTTDIYELTQMKENGGYAWFYLSGNFGGEYVFGDNTAYDREATEINEAYKTALDNKIQQLKDLALWNTVVGFTTEEILIGDQSSGMTQAQFAIWTKYLADTYGKRFNACLSTYEVKGNTDTGTTAANAETYAYVTDIGYDWYTGDLAGHQTLLSTLQTNIGSRTDVKYWFYPTAYSYDEADDDVLSGTPTRTDATIAEQIRMFDTLLQSIDEAQRGGLYFYTWSDWSDSYGLESLIGEFDYTETCAALIEVASKYVD